jgi:outer membrane protein TolC
MLKKTGLAFIILSITLGPLIASAQSADSAVVFNPLLDDITLRIPPLQDLIDSAYIHSPLLKIADADISMSKYEITSTRRQWMDNFYIDGSMAKDYYNGLTTNEVVNTNPNQILTNQDNIRMLAGVSIRLPMLAFWDLHNQVKTATKKLERAISVKENQKLELRKEIITRYNQLIVNQRMLKIANDNITFSALHKDMAEKEFINGQSNLYEVARVSEMHRKAIADFESARFEFYNAYMILQEIVGTKFNVIYKIE